MTDKGLIIIFVVVCLFLSYSYARAETCYSDAQVQHIANMYESEEECQSDKLKLKADRIRLQAVEAQFVTQKIKVVKLEDRHDKLNMTWIKSVSSVAILALLLL